MNETNKTPPTLCIGLDIAWFGGQEKIKESQYDCISWDILNGRSESGLEKERIPLKTRDSQERRDPDAEDTFAVLKRLFDKRAKNGTRIILAIDAPIQAADRNPPLPERQSKREKRNEGEPKKVKWRACEHRLKEALEPISEAKDVCDCWHPSPQPGAPLAPRVERLLTKLVGEGFVLWTPQERDSTKLIIECYPHEAIWAAKCQDGYLPNLSFACVNTYKRLAERRQAHRLLDEKRIYRLVSNVLGGFSRVSGDAKHWNQLVQEAIDWFIDDDEPGWRDKNWQDNGLYRGGKLLDDPVDSVICLAVALSYARGCAHVWRKDPQKAPTPESPEDDGHIIGPGCPQGDHWESANRCVE